MRRREAYFSGRVQGVGFRYTVQNLALRYDVGGYVKNLPDGRVELVVEGNPDEIEQLVGDIEQRMGSFIAEVSADDRPATGEFSEFAIRH